ncbi:DMT family transporter [Altericista sp. CCNU0014]|uniref:DMT family transporter n=1 Tax=Altericista sp. CCNU0014 TaxID=3082949 RepID=UPI00384E61D2
MQDSSTHPKSLLQWLLLIAPFFLWGTAMVAMKGVMDRSSPLFVGTLRLVPAGLLVILAAALLGKAQPRGWKAWLWIVLFALVDATLFQGFLVTGLSKTGAGLGSVMIDSQPLAVALLAWLLYGEQVRFWGWLGLSIGIAGISCIGLPDEWLLDWFGGHFAWPTLDLSPWDSVQAFLSRGESWMLLAALSMAVGTVMIQRVSKYVDPVMATGWHMAIGGIPLLIGSLLWENDPWQALTLQSWLAMGYSTVFGSAIAYGLFFWFASKGNLTSLSALTFLTPVFALIFGNLFLAEVLSPIQFLGVCLTLVSIYLVNQRDRLPKLWERLPAIDEAEPLPPSTSIAIPVSEQDMSASASLGSDRQR